MKQEELKAWQPDQFDRFVRILEQDQLNHAYLFSGFFGSSEMAQFLAKSLFCTDKVGVLPCEKCRNWKLIEQEEGFKTNILVLVSLDLGKRLRNGEGLKIRG